MSKFSLYNVKKEKIKEIIMGSTIDQINIITSYTQIVANLFTVIAVGISLIVFANQKHRELKYKSIETGSEIEQIVSRWAYIDRVLKASFADTYNILANKTDKNMILFEDTEIKSVYTNSELKKIKFIFTENKFNSDFIGGTKEIFKVNLNKVNSANIAHPQDILLQLEQNSASDYPRLFNNYIVMTLNKMETISVKLKLKVADDNTLYTLIGERFYQFTKVMYYYIAKTNNTSKDGSKQMVNLIYLFNKWKKKRK